MKAVVTGFAVSVMAIGLAAGVRALEQPSPEEPNRPCVSAEGGFVEIHTDDHQLLLCRDGHADQTFRVRLARAGLGKAKEGDNKVPLGLYPLGEPRPSEQFWRFIPIGYPTLEQRKRGLTGGNVGIHGPRRSARWLGSILRWFDSTHGCIALAYDEELDTIVAWLRETKTDRVNID